MKKTTPIMIDKTSKENRPNLIVPISTDDDIDEDTSFNNTIIKTEVVSNNEIKQEEKTENDFNNDEIYKKELGDNGEKTITSIKNEIKEPKKVDIASLLNSVTVGKKMIIKAKEKDGVVKVKAMFKSLMVDKEEAAKKNIEADFITYIVALVNNKIVFETTTSGFISENPLLKFSFIGAKKGDELVIVMKVLNGESYMGKNKIK